MKLFIVFLFSFNLFSAEILQSSKELPSDFRKLITTIQNYPLSEEENKTLKSKLLNLNPLLSKLHQKERIFLTKTLLYKYLLESIHINTSISPEQENEVIKKIENKFTNPDYPFHIMLQKAVLADHKYQQKLIGFKRTKEKIIKKEVINSLSMIEIKENYLRYLRLLTLLANNNEDELRAFLKPHIFKIIDKLTLTIKSFTLLSKQEVKAKNQKFFFLEKKIKEVKKEPIERIKIPVKVEKKKPKKKKKEEWKPKKSIPLDYPKKDKDYVAPENLPSPVKDWTL